MKRMMLILTICIMLSGCTKSSYEQLNPSDGTQSTSRVILEDCVDWQIGCGSYEEYVEFIEGDPALPSQFIYYQQIAELGAFRRFDGDPWASDEYVDYAVYYYTLEDAYGRTFQISGRRFSSSEDYMEVQPVTPEDMRTVSQSTQTYRVYTSGNLKYTYRKTGKLFHIEWKVDDLVFTLLAADGFSAFEPNPDGTFVERMLCLESAPGAVEDFAEMISAPYNPEDNPSS